MGLPKATRIPRRLLRANALRINDMGWGSGVARRPLRATTDVALRHLLEMIADCGLRTGCLPERIPHDPAIRNHLRSDLQENLLPVKHAENHEPKHDETHRV